MKHHVRIREGNPSGLYNEISPDVKLTPNDFIEAQRMLLVLRPDDITEINIGIVAAYLEKQKDTEGAYTKVKDVLRQVADSPYLPEEAKMSIEVVLR